MLAGVDWLVIDRKLLVFQFVANDYAIDIVFLGKQQNHLEKDNF